MVNQRLPPLLELKPLHWRDVAIACTLTLLYLNFLLLVQHPVTANYGEGWDGYYYYLMAAHANLEDIYFPLWLRYGLPELAHYFPTHDIVLNFKLINLAAALLYSVVCYLLFARCSKHLHGAVPFLGWLLVCAHNLAPLPYVLWYPIQTDAVSNLFSLLFLLMVIEGWLFFIAVALLFFLGTSVRENFPEFLIFLLLRLRMMPIAPGNLSMSLQNTWRAAKPLVPFALVALAASALGLYGIKVNTGYNPLEDKAAFMWGNFLEFVANPAHLFAVLSMGISTIVIIYLASRICGWRTNEHFASTPTTWLVLLVLSCISQLGGTNPERYWYWNLPLFVLVILPALHYLIKQRYWLVLGLCFGWAAIIHRMFVPIDSIAAGRDCSVVAIVLGSSNWMGHWTDQCDTGSQLNLVMVTVCVLAVILAVAFLQRRTAQACAT